MMTENSLQEMPFIPKMENVKVFAKGLLWCVLLVSPPFLYEVWDAVKHYEHVDWQHIEFETGLIFGPAVGAYWRRWRPLVAPPEEQA